jgi:hypothetical protein
MSLTGKKMENMIESIPESLRGDLSKRLVNIVLSKQEKNIISSDLAKKNYLYLETRPADNSCGFECVVRGCFES